MANSILKLNVESSEYDAKLKKAAEGIRHLADVAHKSGGELTGLEKAELDYIKALGDMETKSRTAAGSVRELESTFKELTVIYNNLNDVEKADEGGKALAASLEKLKQRAIDARAGLNEASQALQTNSEKGGLMGGIMDTLSSKLTFNVDALKLFNAGLQATQAALNVAKDAFFASEANVDEWGRTVQSAQSLYEGFLNAINNGDISGYLSRMGEIVEAARNAYNEMDRLGTMKTIQKPQISKQQAENDRYRAMLQTGRWISAADGRQSSLGYKDGDVMSKEHLKIIEQQLQNGMNVIVALHKNEVQQQTKAIDAEYKSMATDLGMSLEEFRKGTSSMAKFDEVVEGARQLHRWEAEHTGEYNPTTRTYSMTAPVPKELEKYRGWDNFRVDGERYNKLADFIQQRDQHMSQIYQMQGQTYRTINRAEGTTVSKIMGNTGTGGTKVTPQEQAQKAVEAALLSYNQSLEMAKMSLDNGTATEAATKKKLLSAEEQLWTAYGKAYAIYSDPAYKTAQDESAKKIKELGGEVVNAVEAQKKQEQATRELEAAQKKLADAQRELATARNSGKLGDIYSAEKKVATAQGEVTRLESGQPLAIPDEKTVTIKANTENITAQIAHLKEQMGNLEIGSIAFDKTQESFVDMNTLQSLINTQLKAGLKIDQTVTSDLMQQILGGQNIDDTTWQALIDEINQKLAELELPPIKLNFQTGEVAKDAKAAAKEWQAAGSAIQSVGSAMTQIEDPAAKVLGTVAQAIASVALAASQAIGAEDTTASGWAWIGAAAAITGTMISTIAAIKSATAGAYAEGGIIPGTHYSSDMQLAEVNAGELILNRSQQNTIANQLQGGTLGNLHLSATVSGEQIRLVLNNNGKRTGRGEYLTTRFS